MEIKQKKIMIVGMGKSGAALMDVLLSLSAEVYLYDSKTQDAIDQKIVSKAEENRIPLFFGKEPEDISFLDRIIMSPGVPLDSGLVQRAKEKGIEITGELELAYKLCRGQFIGITGTNGKTTTTALTGAIFKKAELEHFVVGNIGTVAVSKAGQVSEEGYMITEISSFQLETIQDFKPHIAALLNITEDHLNRHKTMENYMDAKARIFMNQTKTDYLVVNYDDALAYQVAQRAKSQIIPFSRRTVLEKGCFVKDGNLMIRGLSLGDKGETESLICPVKNIKLPGLHNLENAMAATCIAILSHIKIPIIKETLESFNSVEHRLEYVDTIQGVRFINDSKGTNPDSSIKAIESMEKDVVLIAGGMDKGSDFNALIDAFHDKIKHMVLLGETAEKIKRTAENKGFYAISIKNSMKECVEEAFRLAKPGYTVLLSPACASWDMYPNYEVRGKDFKNHVMQIGRTHHGQEKV
jgi:UDP-N-acetylmuramoylalanine--D-glutamate ligase